MRTKGFTLIEVLVVLAIIATLLSLVAPRYFDTIYRAKESSLKHDLATMRDAIDKYYADTGTYPDALEDMVQKKYLRAIPEDPITGSSLTWTMVPPTDPEAKGLIYDIRSGSPDVAEDGTNYADW
ncbi:type II secretion system protein [Methylovorus glucosotrophus]|uniref:Type II secretion system protein G n=1 Tax=Methylovorus glucosotrophus (strain SIP3-4) TaxID=582744 RepID=C6XC11_METGS|nr:prepilin-type N-terminal cleavage/methylation domain-containing protein [Methylovorus glucosotrophus]ACT50086.1 type II secretion system protein G [Methylovorus glucosotrophus SIP3-4]